MKTKQKLLAALCGCAFSHSSLETEEGGSGHYLPGSRSSSMDAPPPKGAFIARYNMVFYRGDLSVDEPLSIAGLQTLGAAADSWAHGLTLGWGLLVDLGERLTWSITATVPFVWMDVSANITAGGVTGQRTSSANGLGDIVLMPLMLNDTISSNWSANFRVAGYAPTGDYEVGRLANTGKNFWTIEPTLGLMYFGQKTGKKPNVVWLLVDDTGFGDPGCYGGGKAIGADTPHMDRLAAEGLRLTSCYSQNTCTPTRSAMLTGRLPVRTGLIRPILAGDKLTVNPWEGETSLPKILGESGCNTLLVGKWHIGSAKGMRPHEVGFDEYSGDYGAAKETSQAVGHRMNGWLASLAAEMGDHTATFKKYPPKKIGL